MTQDTSVMQTTTMSTVLMLIQDMLVTPTARSYSTQVSPPIETTGYHSHDLSDGLLRISGAGTSRGGDIEVFNKAQGKHRLIR